MISSLGLVFFSVIAFHLSEARQYSVPRESLVAFLLEENASTVPPPKDLPTPTSGGPCPPPNPDQFQDVATDIVISITDTTGCYSIMSPGFPAPYPNAFGGDGNPATYTCNYEIQIVDPPANIRFKLNQADFELQAPANTMPPSCRNDLLRIKNIVENTSITAGDDKETFNNQVIFCGDLSTDYDFEVNPGGSTNKFQLTFKANRIVNGMGFKGLLCFP